MSLEEKLSKKGFLHGDIGIWSIFACFIEYGEAQGTIYQAPRCLLNFFFNYKTDSDLRGC